MRVWLYILVVTMALAACQPQFDAPSSANQQQAEQDGLPLEALNRLDEIMRLFNRGDYRLQSAQMASNPAALADFVVDEMWCLVISIPPRERVGELVWHWAIWREGAEWVDALSVTDEDNALWEGAGCGEWATLEPTTTP